MLHILLEGNPTDLFNNKHEIRSIRQSFPRIILCFNDLLPYEISDIERVTARSKSHQKVSCPRVNLSSIPGLMSECGAKEIVQNVEVRLQTFGSPIGQVGVPIKITNAMC